MAPWREFIQEEVNDLIVSPADDRKYRLLQLTNGMRVLVISDPDTDVSAAAMDVHV